MDKVKYKIVIQQNGTNLAQKYEVSENMRLIFQGWTCAIRDADENIVSTFSGSDGEVSTIVHPGYRCNFLNASLKFLPLKGEILSGPDECSENPSAGLNATTTSREQIYEVLNATKNQNAPLNEAGLAQALNSDKSSPLEHTGIDSKQQMLHLYGDISPLQDIRILRLEPSQKQDTPLLFTFVTGNLKDLQDRFEALSYTWGELSFPNHMCSAESGAIVPITRSLDIALRRFRDRTYVRSLWVDAVCINQHNESEKALQISIMKDIYQAASRVVAWLGGDDAEEDALCKLSALSRCASSEAFVDPGLCIDAYFERIFARPYFSRRWIIQEIVSNLDATLVCGRSEISLVRFMTAVNGSMELFKNRPQVIPGLGPMHTLYRLWKSQTQGDPGFELNILDLLDYFEHYQCSNPRDHLYAVYRLASNVVEISAPKAVASTWNDIWMASCDKTEAPHNLRTISLVVDYTLPTESIYSMFAASAMASGYGLNILAMASLRKTKSKLKLPSWVPDWTSKLCPRPRGKLRGNLDSFSIASDDSVKVGLKAFVIHDQSARRSVACGEQHEGMADKTYEFRCFDGLLPRAKKASTRVDYAKVKQNEAYSIALGPTFDSCDLLHAAGETSTSVHTITFWRKNHPPKPPAKNPFVPDILKRTKSHTPVLPTNESDIPHIFEELGLVGPSLADFEKLVNTDLKITLEIRHIGSTPGYYPVAISSISCRTFFQDDSPGDMRESHRPYTIFSTSVTPTITKASENPYLSFLSFFGISNVPIEEDDCFLVPKDWNEPEGQVDSVFYYAMALRRTKRGYNLLGLAYLIPICAHMRWDNDSQEWKMEPDCTKRHKLTTCGFGESNVIITLE